MQIIVHTPVGMFESKERKVSADQLEWEKTLITNIVREGNGVLSFDAPGGSEVMIPSALLRQSVVKILP